MVVQLVYTESVGGERPLPRVAVPDPSVSKSPALVVQRRSLPKMAERQLLAQADVRRSMRERQQRPKARRSRRVSSRPLQVIRTSSGERLPMIERPAKQNTSRSNVGTFRAFHRIQQRWHVGLRRLVASG